MICPRCGTAQIAGAERCSACAEALFAPAETRAATAPAGVPALSGDALPDYAGPALLVTLFACLPVGLIARRYSQRVRLKQALGDEAGAQACSRQARLWCWRGGVAGAVGWSLAVLAAFVARQLPG